jgi:hypothetical protein
MTFTNPSTTLPRLIPGKRNRSSLETFQSPYVDNKVVEEAPSSTLKMEAEYCQIGKLEGEYHLKFRDIGGKMSSCFI